MHTLEEIRAEYDRLDRLCGVDTSAVEITISRRGVRRLGSFRYPAKGRAGALRITLNASLLDAEEAFCATVAHESAPPRRTAWPRCGLESRLSGAGLFPGPAGRPNGGRPGGTGTPGKVQGAVRPMRPDDLLSAAGQGGGPAAPGPRRAGPLRPMRRQQACIVRQTQPLNIQKPMNMHQNHEYS